MQWLSHLFWLAKSGSSIAWLGHSRKARSIEPETWRPSLRRRSQSAAALTLHPHQT